MKLKEQAIMENNIAEKMRTGAQRSFRISAALLIFSLSGLVRISTNSTIRMVDVLSILACGIIIGAFIVNLAILLKVKKLSGK